MLYSTTAEFLQYLGLDSLTDLPSLADLERMLADRESAARLVDEEELRAMEEAAKAGPPPAGEENVPLPAAARFEARRIELDLPTLDELDVELRERTERVAELSGRVAAVRRSHAAELETPADAATGTSSPVPFEPDATAVEGPVPALADEPRATADASEGCA